jgi:DnaJ family protein C protein 2
MTLLLLLLLLLFSSYCSINAKLREKGKKEEGRRLREFVDAAYRVDPRVIARKEAQSAER